MQRISIKVRLTPQSYAKILDRCIREGLSVEDAAKMLLSRWMASPTVTDAVKSMTRRPEPQSAGNFPIASPGKLDSFDPAGGYSEEVDE